MGLTMAVASWTIILAVILVVVSLATVLVIALGRASARADEESERLLAEHRRSSQSTPQAEQSGEAEAEDILIAAEAEPVGE